MASPRLSWQGVNGCSRPGCRLSHGSPSWFHCACLRGCGMADPVRLLPFAPASVVASPRLPGQALNGRSRRAAAFRTGLRRGFAVPAWASAEWPIPSGCCLSHRSPSWLCCACLRRGLMVDPVRVVGFFAVCRCFCLRALVRPAQRLAGLRHAQRLAFTVPAHLDDQHQQHERQ